MNRFPIVLACSLLTFLSASALAASWDDGVSAFSAGRYEEAAAAFESFVGRSPEAPAGHFMLGQSLLRQKRFAAALGPLDRAVALSPSETRYALALAQVQLELGKADAALDTLAAGSPDDVPSDLRQGFNQLLAKASTSTSQGAVALAHLEKAIAVDEADKTLHLALAKMAGRLDDPERAFTALAAAYEIDPRDVEVGRSAVGKAMDVGDQKDRGAKSRTDWYRKGSTIARQLATAFPTPENLLLAGDAEMSAKDYQAAAGRFEQALAAGTDDQRLRFNLGSSHLALGNNEQALAHLEAALAHGGEGLLTQIHAARASALFDLKRFDAAAAAFRLAGNAGKAAEIEHYVENRQEWEAAKAGCVEKRERISELLEGGDGLEDSPEWKELEEEAAAILAACEPYLHDPHD